MAKTPGLLNLSANFEVNSATPLDARQLVNTFNDLLLEETFGNFAFKGMISVVINDTDSTKNGLYILSELPYTVANNWVKSGSGGGGGEGAGYTQSFDSTELTSGKITITHNLNSPHVLFALFNNENKYILPDNFSIVDENNVEIELATFVATMTGTYTCIISTSGGGSGGGIPEAPEDGKQYGRQNATWTEVISYTPDILLLPYAITKLNNDSTSEEIITAFGGEDKINEFTEKMKNSTTEFFIEEVNYTDVLGISPLIHRRFINPVRRYTIEFMYLGQYIIMEFSDQYSSWALKVVKINMDRVYFDFDSINSITSSTSVADAMNIFGGTREFQLLTSKLRSNSLEILMSSLSVKNNVVKVIQYTSNNTELELWYVYDNKLTYLRIFNNFSPEILRIDTPISGGGGGGTGDYNDLTNKPQITYL